MPRNVRNFWVEVDTGDRVIATGPRRADGIVDVTVWVREEGHVIRGVSLAGRVADGTLTITARSEQCDCVTLGEWTR